MQIVGGIPEVVKDNITGLLVPFGDPLKTARAVETLIRDEELRRRLGRAAALTHARNQFFRRSYRITLRNALPSSLRQATS